MKLTTLLLSLLLPIVLSACGDGARKIGATINTIDISSTGASTTVNETGTFNLIISGTDNTVSVSENNDIKALTVSGDNNLITINSGSTVQTLVISGNDNVIDDLSDSITSWEDTGSGNSVQ
jgi:uncharacterized lipoprotein YehR (DUF1307 family)